MAGLFDFFNLTDLATRMAEANIHPEAITQAITSNSPRIGDLAQPGGVLEPPSQAGRNRDLKSVDNTMQGFFENLRNGTGPFEPPSVGGLKRDFDAGNNGMMSIMHALTGGMGQEPIAGTPPQAGTPMAPPVAPPAPPPDLSLLMTGAARPGVPGSNGNGLPVGMPRPEGPALAMPGMPQAPVPPGPLQMPTENVPIMAPAPIAQPLLANGIAQPMQPNRPGIERPESATSPHLNTDAEGVKNTVMQTFYAGGVTNPFGLAALASTGKHESGFSPKNMARSWSDPSESGQQGTSGGLFSFRNERLKALRDFATANGEEGNGSPATQAKFFMQEDPQLIERLNSAKSVEEAQSLLNQNIAFAGYNREGGEAGRRLQTARVELPGMEAMVGAPPSVQESTVAAADAGAPVAGAAPGTTVTPPKSFADRLGELGKSIKAPPPNDNLKPPSGTAPLPQSGSLTPNPAAMQMILSMIGGTGGSVPQVAPTLAQLLGGK